MNDKSIHLRPAEKTTHIFGILLAVLGGDDYLVFFCRFDTRSVWVAFDEHFDSKRPFACDGNRSEVWVVRGVL